jgi:hypothetical protein
MDRLCRVGRFSGLAISASDRQGDRLTRTRQAQGCAGPSGRWRPRHMGRPWREPSRPPHIFRSDVMTGKSNTTSRQRQSGEMSTAHMGPITLTLKIDRELFVQLEQLAAEQRKSVRSLVQRAIQRLAGLREGRAVTAEISGVGVITRRRGRPLGSTNAAMTQRQSGAAIARPERESTVSRAGSSGPNHSSGQRSPGGRARRSSTR